jgi:hypothetical protein
VLQEAPPIVHLIQKRMAYTYVRQPHVVPVVLEKEQMEGIIAVTLQAKPPIAHIPTTIKQRDNVQIILVVPQDIKF